MLDHEPVDNDMDNAPSGREQRGDEASPAPAAKRVRRRAASRPAGAPDSAIAAAGAAASAELAQSDADSDTSAQPDAPAPAKRAARKRTTKKTAAAQPAAEAPESDEAARPAAAAEQPPQAEQAEEPEAAPVASTRRTRKRAASRAAGAPSAAAAPPPEPEAAAEAEPAAATEQAEDSAETKPVANAKRTRKAGAAKRPAKRAAASPDESAAPAEQAEQPAAAAEEHAEQPQQAEEPAARQEQQQPEQEQPKEPQPRKRRRRGAAQEEPAAEPVAAEAPVVAVALPEELEEGEAAEELVAAEGAGDEDAAEAASVPPLPAWTGSLFQAPIVQVAPVRRPAVPIAPVEPEPEVEEHEDEESEDAAGSSASSRRRRRRRNRRGESGGGAEAADSDSAEDSEQDGEEPEQSERPEKSGKGGGAEQREAADLSDDSSRRRRRRRRRQTAEDLAAGVDTSDDPPNTVVKVREPRQRRSSGGPDTVTTEDDVMGLRGSVRLVAKQQRRREGRATRSRRAPIVTEAEFLARRESVERVMVVRQSAGRTQIGVLEDGVLVEHYVNRESSVSYVGNVYLGKVQNVLPSMEAAFVDINKGRNAVLYAGEVNFDAAGLSGQPRRIESALKSGQSVLVQVTKDPIGHKGARLTSQISLPGRFLVYIPGGSMMGISRKLPDTERTRLKQILKKVVPEDGGVIVRTAAEGASEQELSQDVARLVAQWEEIERKAKTASAPALLSGEPDLTVRVVRDIFNEDFSKLIVSGDTGYKTVHEYLTGVAPELAERVEHWTSETDVFSVYRIEEQLAKALDRKVWLPSGGSLVIDRTEAMVVIDVNTGKFTGQGSSSLEETVTRNNLEAAEEIVRQLRLRDLGGIVVIDFIDMVLEQNRDLVLRRLLECLGRDRTKHQVAEVTSLGLVQMTRKRVGQGLLEAFSEPCEVCNGRGVIVHTEPVEHSGRRAEQGSGKQSKQQRGEAPEHEHTADAAEAEAPAERSEEAGEGRRSRRRRKAGRAATNEAHEGGQESAESVPEATEPADEHGHEDAGAAADASAEARRASQAPEPEPEAEPAEREISAEQQQEEAAALNLKAHAEDPDALENALADSGRPRRRARRTASRPAGAPSA